MSQRRFKKKACVRNKQLTLSENNFCIRRFPFIFIDIVRHIIHWANKRASKRVRKKNSSVQANFFFVNRMKCLLTHYLSTIQGSYAYHRFYVPLLWHVLNSTSEVEYRPEIGKCNAPKLKKWNESFIESEKKIRKLVVTSKVSVTHYN